jgi:pimeloyl-ACP methyl ester carboxylesterase
LRDAAPCSPAAIGEPAARLHPPDLAGIHAPVLPLHGRYDRTVPFEVSIAILNHITDWHLFLFNNCGHWPQFEWTTQVLAILGGDRERREVQP